MPLGYLPNMTDTSRADTGETDTRDIDTRETDTGETDEHATQHGPEHDSLLSEQDAPLGGFGHATSIEPGREDARDSDDQS
jgi:hypothetical protein